MFQPRCYFNKLVELRCVFMERTSNLFSLSVMPPVVVVVGLVVVVVVGLVVGYVVVVVVGLVVGLVVVIEVGLRDQSVTIQRNSARCDGWVHYCGINLQQFGANRRAETDCCTFAGSICNMLFGTIRRAMRPIAALSLVQCAKIQHNSARCDELQHFRGIRQFGVP